MLTNAGYRRVEVQAMAKLDEQRSDSPNSKPPESWSDRWTPHVRTKRSWNWTCLIPSDDPLPTKIDVVVTTLKKESSWLHIEATRCILVRHAAN
jgi:hypothetical protein